MIAVEETESGEAGFTLMELLVAIALLALMATYALNALSYMRNFDRVIGRIEHQAEVEATARHIRQTFSDTRLVFGNDEDARVEFDGRSDVLKLVSVLNRDLATGGLFRLRYGLRQKSGSGNGEGLVFTVWRELFRPIRGSEETPVEGGEPTILMDGVQSLKFRYFGSREPDKPPAWLESWPASETLPKLISLDVTFPAGDTRRWPQLIIPIQASR